MDFPFVLSPSTLLRTGLSKPYDVRDTPLKELAALGATGARSAKEVSEHGEIIELVVVDDAQIEAITLGEGGSERRQAGEHHRHS